VGEDPPRRATDLRCRLIGEPLDVTIRSDLGHIGLLKFD
jgi:hypothetical protein